MTGTVTFTVTAAPSGHDNTGSEKTAAGLYDPCILHTDIFIFNDDALRRIDAYQRCYGGERAKAASRRGRKLLVAIANSSMKPEEWHRVSSYEGLLEEIACLKDESSSYPLMSGTIRINPEQGYSYEIDMERLVSEICIRSIRADFSGSAYEGKPLTDVKIYLTNVNAACRIMKDSGFRPEMIVNPGFLDIDALYGFKDRSLLYAELEDAVRTASIHPDIRLFCYPNDSREETPGSPFTRLVIEGRIDGYRYWYPITVNRGDSGIASGGDGKGIGRNCRYVYDITLYRTGTDDPDKPVSKSEVGIVCNVLPWDEKDNVEMTF